MAKTVFGMPGLSKKTAADGKAEKAPNKPEHSASTSIPLASPKSGPGTVPMASPASPFARQTAEKQRMPADGSRTMFGMPAVKLPLGASSPASTPEPKKEPRPPEEAAPMYADTLELQAGPKGAAVGPGGRPENKAAFKATVLGMTAVKPEDADVSATSPAAVGAPETTAEPSAPAATVVLDGMSSDKTALLEAAPRDSFPAPGESWTDAGLGAAATRLDAADKTVASSSVPLSVAPKAKKKSSVLLIVLIVLAVAAATAVGLLLALRLMDKPAALNVIPSATPSGAPTAPQQQSPAQAL
jgi:hypothetical protein